MTLARQIPKIALAAGMIAVSAMPATAGVFADRPTSLVKGLHLGYERGAGSEAYAPQDLSAAHPQIERFYAQLKGHVAPDVGFWLNVSRGSYQFDDEVFPGTRHLRHETRVVASLTRGGEFAGGGWNLGVGYGLNLLQVQSSARLADTDPAFYFLPWQALHGVTISESVRMGLGPVGFAVDGDWSPYLFAQLADTRLSMPAYLTAFRVTPRLTFWDDRISLGYAFERTLGSGFDRQSAGPFMAFTVAGF